MTFSELMIQIDRVLRYTLFEVNQTAVTTLSLVFFLVMLLCFIVLSHILQRMLLKRVFNYLRLDHGTSYTLGRIIHYVVMIVGVILAFQFIGINLSGLAFVFGFLSVGIGFGLQNVTSNFVSGLILLLERPIKVGHRVTVGDINGDVVEINLRSTTVRSERNISIIVPNSEFISSQVINWSHGDPKVRMDFDVGVSYESDLDLVLTCLAEVAEENELVMENPPPEVYLAEFGDSSWNMQLRAWIPDPKQFRAVRSEINCGIVRKFRKHNIQIPFPQRDLHVRTTIPLPIVNNANYQN